MSAILALSLCLYKGPEVNRIALPLPFRKFGKSDSGGPLWPNLACILRDRVTISRFKLLKKQILKCLEAGIRAKRFCFALYARLQKARIL